MPSKSRDADVGRLGGREPTPKKELSIIALSDSLRSQIRVLIASRQSMFDRVRAHREGGQVVPTSVCEALDENALYLRDALDRYADTTTHR